VILRFCRTKFVGYEWETSNILKIYGTLDDTLYSMQVEMKIKLPDLLIISLDGKMRRFTTPFCEESVKFLEKGIGLKVTEGFQHEIKRLIARPGCRHFGNLIVECLDSILPALFCMEYKQLRETDPSIPMSTVFKKIYTSYPQLASFCPQFSELNKGDLSVH